MSVEVPGKKRSLKDIWGNFTEEGTYGLRIEEQIDLERLVGEAFVKSKGTEVVVKKHEALAFSQLARGAIRKREGYVESKSLDSSY